MLNDPDEVTRETAWDERLNTLKLLFKNIDWKKPLHWFKMKDQWDISINHKLTGRYAGNYIANTLAIVYFSKKHFAYVRDDMPSAICITFGWEKIYISLGRKGPEGHKHHLFYVHTIDDELGIRVRRFL